MPLFYHHPQKCMSYSKFIRKGCKRIPELKSEWGASRASSSLRGPIIATPGRYNFLLSASCLSISTLCFSIFANVLICSFIVQAGSLLSVPSSHPPISLFFFFFPFAFTARRPVFYNDISVSFLHWSWLIHRWHDEIHSLFFFSPAVPHLPIKPRLNVSNWCLSRGGMNWN